MQQKIERMQEGVSLAQGEKKHLAGQQLTPRYEVVQQLKDARKAQDMTQEVLAERVGTKSLIFPDLRAANIIQALIS